MAFETLTAEQYRELDYDSLIARRDAIADAFDDPENDVEAIEADGKLFKAEVARRAKQVEIRSLKIDQVMGGAGTVVDTSKNTGKVHVKRDNSLGARVWDELQKNKFGRERKFELPNISFRAYNDTQTVGELDGENSPNYFDEVLTDVDTEIREGYRRPLTIWDLFNHETTSKDSVAWYVEGTFEGSAAMTAETGKFAQIHVNDPVRASSELKKVTAFWKQSDEILTDAPRFVSHVNSRAGYNLDIVVEDQLVGGDGTGNNITGLVNTSGLLTASASGYNLSFIESLLAQKTLIRKATPNFNVDTLLVADEDYDTLQTLRNESDQYVLGGPVGLVYGNSVTVGDVLWRTIRIVPTPALTSGTSILGAFKRGGTIYSHVTGRRFDVGYDGEDFSHGLVSFRAYQRFVLAVEYPAAFCKYSVETGSSI